MNVLRLLIVLLYLTEMPLRAIEPYRTEVSDKHVRSLRVRVAGKHHSAPIIELDGKDRIEINFDLLHENTGWIAYSITHCNADWTPSGIPFSGALTGFRDLEIDDFAHSLNTKTEYTNYRLFLPNGDVRFKIAGNYVIKIYEEENPEHVYLTACCSVIDPQVRISGYVSNIQDNSKQDNTFDKEYQQVNFVADYSGHVLDNPLTRVKACVYQNRRQDNAAYNVSPVRVTREQIIYDHSKELIFEAGNEYRRMEFLNFKEKGMHVEEIGFRYPFPQIKLMKDFPRNAFYFPDADQNGAFSLRSTTARDLETEGDYAVVHFSLVTDSIPEGDVYLTGELFQNGLNDLNRMKYNAGKQQYEKNVFLKEGSYNYQYLVVPPGEKKGHVRHIEGNFSETENEYLILIYQQNADPAYDKLIGMQKVLSK